MTRPLIPPPNLILPRKTGLIHTVEAVLPPLRLEGWVTAELIDSATQTVIRRERWRNLITNAGLDVIGAGGSPLNLTSGAVLGGTGYYMGVGTGSTPADPADGTLDAELADPATNRSRANGGVASTQGYVAGPPDYWWGIRRYYFTNAQANGNLTECGLFSATTAGTMFMRSLIRDSGGTPTTITKTSAEELRIHYELRMYPPTTDATVIDLDISGTLTDLIIRPRSVGDAATWLAGNYGDFANSVGQGQGFSGGIAARTGSPGGSIVNSGSSTWAAYTGGNYYRDVTSIFQAANGDYAFASMTCNTRWQIGFTPAVAKDNTKRFTITTRHSWARL